MLSYSSIIGLRYLRAPREEAFLSVITIISILGIALGVMALIIVLSVMSGFTRDFKEKLVGVSAPIMVTRHEGPISNYRELMEELNQQEGVVASSPYIMNQVMLSAGGNVAGVLLRGVDPATVKDVTIIEKVMISGDLDALESSSGWIEEEGEEILKHPGIILGRELAMMLGTFEGELLSVISPNGKIGPIGMVPKMKQFRVIGIFDSGMYDYDNGLALISLHAAQDFFELGDAVTGIDLKISDIDRAPVLATSIRNHLGAGFAVRDWMSLNRNLFSALRLEKRVMFIILVLIVLVAAFGIVSLLVMVVMKKRKEIAILKSMGATSCGIMKIFVVEGLIMGIVGTVLGTVSGLLVALNLTEISNFLEETLGWELFPKDVYYIDQFPSYVNPIDVVTIVGVALLICFIATLYPSWQAARLLPTDAIRYE